MAFTFTFALALAFAFAFAYYQTGVLTVYASNYMMLFSDTSMKLTIR